jgi:hypothetical protein
MRRTPKADAMEEPQHIREDAYEPFLGVVLPAALLILASVNFVTGTALMVVRGWKIHSITEPTAVAGFIAIEIALAIGLFAWFWLANRSKFDPYIIPIQIGAVSLGAIGLLLLLIALFV